MNIIELIQKDNAAPILKVVGRLDALTSPDFEKTVEPLLNSTKFLIIDLKECSYLSSTGIRILLISHKRLHSAQGKLFITALSSEVYQVIEMAGLHHIFNLVNSTELALKEIEQLHQECSEIVCFNQGDLRFKFQKICKKEDKLFYWKTKEIVGCNELGISIGYGAFAESDDLSSLCKGILVTAGVCAGLMPDDLTIPSDFRVSPNPANIALLIQGATSFGDKPSAILSAMEQHLTMQKFISASNMAKKQFPVLGISLMVLQNRDSDNPSLSIILVVEDGIEISELWQHLPGFIQKNILPAGSENPPGLTFKLEKLHQTDDAVSLLKFLSENLTIDNIKNVEPIFVEEKLLSPSAWLFLPQDIADAETLRLSIETKNQLIIEPYQQFLIRKLYADATRVIIEPLHGGYSAQTFQVTSFDKFGRKMRPTVLKVASRAMITRESERCQLYALPYIFNNSAAVLGTEFHRDKGALVYNFVGIGGEDSHLKWLTHYFHNENMELLGPLFDKIFTQILKPWYGQAVQTTIFPFKDHDPTLSFFPHIFRTVDELFSISSDEKFIEVPGSGRKILNPYWFLKNEFPKLRDRGFSYYEGICHGDLNMQNILLDENMNVYLIDFSETKPRSAISDFARLEAIFIGDNAPLESEEDMEAYLEFVTSFYTSDYLNEDPAYIYRGRERERVMKQASLSLKMRGYAFESVHRDPDITLYYIALLEWLFPIVCYSSLSEMHKWLSMYICGLLCEKVDKKLQQ